jgi:GNAT superfamily N-acetyltransferase
MSFIKNIWGGHDYIPSVWDYWLRDTRNRMFVVEVDGFPAGMNRTRFLEDGSAWLEGARVHPRYRGQGLATMLGENSMKVAAKRGIRVFRLTSGSRNKAAHRQIARIKFTEISRFSIYQPRRMEAKKHVAQKLSVELAEEATSMIQDTREYRLGHGVFWHNFAAATLTPEVVKSLVQKEAVWRNGQAIAVSVVGGEGAEAWEEVCFIGGPPSEAVELAKSLLGSIKRATERWVFVPQGSPIIPALRQAGFSRIFSNILFERRATKG